MTVDQLPPQSLAAVGRSGELHLDYARQGPKTVITEAHCTTPWHFVPPIYLDESGSAYTLLLNPSGGLVGGDRLSVRMTLGPESHVLVSAPSANRVYRSPSEASAQIVDVTLGHGAVFEWLPEPTIPFAGSRFRQAIHVKLHAGATVLLWDAIASGRIARGERWSFTSLENEVKISLHTGDQVMERYNLAPEAERLGVGLAHVWNYVASFYMVGDQVPEDNWKRVEVGINRLLDAEQGIILAGVSQPAVPGLVVKVLARRATDLVRVFDGLWGVARRELWDLPTPDLRRY